MRRSFIALAIGFLTAPALSAIAQEAEGEAKGQTYTQRLQAEEARRTQESEALESNMEDRKNRFGTLPADADPVLKTRYQDRVNAFREALKQVRRLFSRYHLSPQNFDQDTELIGEWDVVLAKTNQETKPLIDAMVDIYRTDNTKYNNLGLSLMEIVRREGQQDRVEHLTEAAKLLLDSPPAPLDAPLVDTIGYIGFANCDFDLAQKAWDKYSETGVLPDGSNSKYKAIDLARQQWTEEQKQRELDKTRDNPIVLLTTSKGTLAVELFEDQAPNSVANFIYLVQNNFYVRQRIFKVVDKVGIQTGCKVGDGTGDAGYIIASEAKNPEARKIFRGSLMYAIGVQSGSTTLDTSTASSQFLIATAPLPALSDYFTVFGRVIDGDFKLGTYYKVDLTDKEQKDDPNVRTDYLVKGRVEKKRDHEYVPILLRGELPF